MFVVTIPPQKLHDITSRAKGRMLEGRVMMEEYLVSSENSGILEELSGYKGCCHMWRLQFQY